MRILVNPDALGALGAQQARAVSDIQDVLRRANGALNSLDWESRHRINIEGLMQRAVEQGNALVVQGNAMSKYLAQKAQAFQEADSQPAGFWDSLNASATPLFRGWPSMPVVGIGSLIGGAMLPAVMPMVRGLDWIRKLIFPEKPPVRLIPRPDGTLQPMPAPPLPPPGTGAQGPVAIPVPRLRQYDGPWKDLAVGSGTWQSSGCLMTDVAMVVKHNTPGVNVDRAFMEKLRDSVTVPNGNLAWDKAAGYLKSEYGLTLVRETTTSVDRVLAKALENARQGIPTIVGVDNPQHWVTITGYTGSDPGRLSAADFTINDPGYSRHNTLSDLLANKAFQSAHVKAVATISKQ